MPGFKATVLIALFAAVPLAGAQDYRYQYEDEKVEIDPVPKLRHFDEVARVARAHNRPMLIEFSTPWCGYCEALEEQILKPLIVSEKYRDAIIISKVEIDGYSRIRGFDGKSYSSEQISMLYDVDLYPTLVFFDPQGKEIGERIVGITVLEYVADHLDKAIDKVLREQQSLISSSGS